MNLWKFFLGLIIIGNLVVSYAQPQIKIDVKPCFGDNFGVGWNPFVVTLENTGSEDFEGKIRLFNNFRLSYYSSEARFSEAQRDIQLSKGSKRRFIMYLDLGREIGDIFWEVYQKEKVVKGFEKRKLKTSSYTREEFRVIVFSKEKGVLRQLNNSTSSSSGSRSPYHYGNIMIKVFEGSSLTAPERKEGYDAVHLVVVNNFPLEGDFSTAQILALKEWVAEGGSLLISPGSESWLKSNFVQEFFPHSIIKTEEKRPDMADAGGVSLHSIEAFDSSRLSEAFLYFHLKYPDNTVFPVFTNSKDVATDVYLAHIPYKKGEVSVLPFDISRRPLKSWGDDGFYDLKILARQSKAFSKPTDVNTTAQKLVAKKKNVSLTGLFFLLFFYVLLIGPGNYYFLYKLKIQSYLILSVTLISIFCVFVVGLYGYYFNGVKNETRMVTIIQPFENHWLETSYLAFYSAYNKSYSFSGEQRTSLRLLLYKDSFRPKTAVKYDQANGRMKMIDVNMAIWATKYFQFTTHHFKNTSIPPLTIERKLDSLTITANQPVEEILVFKRKALLYQTPKKSKQLTPEDPPITVSFSKKPERGKQNTFKIKSFITQQGLSHSGNFIAVRLAKPIHNLQMDGKPLVVDENLVYFIQEIPDD